MTLLLGLGKGLVGKKTSLTLVLDAPILRLARLKVNTDNVFGVVT